MKSSAWRLYLPEAAPEPYLDCVTIKGPRAVEVPQVDGEWPPYAMVQASQTIPRRPFGDSDTRALNQSMRWIEPEIQPVRPGEKWCSDCGEWKATGRFSPRADTYDGLHPHCKDCRAAHARKMRYNASYAASGMNMRPRAWATAF